MMNLIIMFKYSTINIITINIITILCIIIIVNKGRFKGTIITL